MAPTNKVRLVAANGDGVVNAVNRFFRRDGSETAPLPRKAETLEDVTRGIGLERGVAEHVQGIIGQANPSFDQKSQTQRIFLVQSMLIEVLRTFPDISSDQRGELVKRARAYWQFHYQTDYGKRPTVRAHYAKSEPQLVVKAAAALSGDEKRITMPQIIAKKLPEFLAELREDTTKTRRKTLDPATLKPTQDKLDTAKVKRIQGNPEALKKPIVVSKDQFIVDGHHRWAACKALGQKVPCIVVDLSKDDLLAAARDFEGAEYRKADKIPGGLASGKNRRDFDEKRLEAGIKVELEHTSDRGIAAEIAMDHLTEDPDYYQKLKTIEKAEQLGLDFTGSPPPKAGAPAGYAAVPNSQHGGYRKKVGGKYRYWYPEGAKPKRAGKRKKKGPRRVDVWGNLSEAAYGQWDKDVRALAAAHSHLGKMADEEQRRAPGERVRPSAAFTAEFRKLETVTKRFTENLKRWGNKHVAGTAPSMSTMQRISAAFEAIPRSGSMFTYGIFPDAEEPEPDPAALAGKGSYGGTSRDEWSAAARKALTEVRTLIRDESYSNERLRPTETLVRGKVQFVVYASGYLVNQGEGEKVEVNGRPWAVRDSLRAAEAMQKKLDGIGLGKATEGLTIHVHGESRAAAKGESERTNFTTAGYYNIIKDYVDRYSEAVGLIRDVRREFNGRLRAGA